MTWWREPLLHFFAVGALVFAVLPRGEESGRTVVRVDRELVLRVMQERSRRFDRVRAESELDALSPEARRALALEVAREEVLFREALALGLEREDYVTRRRLAQSVELSARGLAGEAAPIDDASLRAHYEATREEHRLPDRVTFEHAFFAEGVEAHCPPGEGATPFFAGDRFESQTWRFLEPTFGGAFVGAVFAMEPGETWQGPLTSAHGSHCVRVVAHERGRLPALEEVRAQVEADLRAAVDTELGEAAVGAILERYEVVVAEELQ
ncbi:MAG: peptidyl-prolyl cis-trans isomerase [Sandaracinus sp.]|nr:peptidyl-prolyl cis-trans isomerase [Sandaracinus sp.]MCB9617888.1 peptidyl-prolyl cis-trans isomerase [Sandaracinus sp.]